MKTYKVREVFTPTSLADLNFVERMPTSNYLVDALRTPGMQIILYGESGSGKSTLMQHKLHQVYENHITTRCHKTLTFENLLLDAFDQLAPFYESSKAKTGNRSKGASLTADYFGIRSSLNAARSETSGVESLRMLPPQLTPQRLAQLIGNASMCWVLDDFHKISMEEKINVSQTLKLFCDMSAEFPCVKIIAIGAVESARQVIQYDTEMRHRVSEIEVKLMEYDELRRILINGFRLMKLKATDRVIDQVSVFSGGLASVAHQFGLNICLESGIETSSSPKPRNSKKDGSAADITDDELRMARQRYIDESSDTLSAAFDKALGPPAGAKYDNCRVILKVLSQGPVTGLTIREMLSDVQSMKGYEKYPRSNLSRYLNDLSNEKRGPLIYLTGGARYRFIDPLHHVYAQAALYGIQHKKNDRTQPTFTEDSMYRELYDDLVSDLKNLDDGYSPDMEEDVVVDGWEEL